ncbi:methyltransferase domain-containing protein [Rhodocytophaga aerolata]|uniref:Methyltransferase domain-containing protein n=1 Tax=Rhodocytophaga aerolata TaxID=455078 RepID=A0ABT8RB02_9BACT|nr:class I SAM-dependent methyltransferase [Rhodocytophaga aerolata]MDO1449257.1 methyltransferase domain-containing protein [Rhodocytophaga aerolata]
MNINFWNTRYATHRELYGKAPNEYFKEKLSILSPGKLLLPGEGEGRNALFAARKGWQVRAFDQSAIAAAQALNKAKVENTLLEYTVCDALDFPYPKELYDAVALIYFHLPLTIRASVHAQLSASLQKGGALMLEGFGKNQLQYTSGGPSNKDLLFDVNELKNEFTDITWVEEHDLEVILMEGKGHDGKAHIVRLYGIKV